MITKQLGMVLTFIAAVLLITAPAPAQVGEQLDKNMSQNITIDEDLLDGAAPEADHAFIKYLRTYVPAQRSNGEPADPIEYRDLDSNVVKTRDVAKPLIGVFTYGPVDYPEPVGDENTEGFYGHGKRDAYAAVSLDDGDSWRTSNLSDSAKEFSQAVPSYPGDVINVVHAVAGRHIAVAWPSRLCQGGSPGYTIDSDSTYTRDLAAVAAHLGIDPEVDLYLTDLFGVAGAQGFIDYTKEGYPTVGDVPFACVWAARGVLVEGDDPNTGDVTEQSYIVWYKPERLTSGRRDAFRIEIQMVGGAGVAITWQEDPGGLRPGQGEGPGDGWSGAIGNSQTDIWYSFLPDANFETVIDANGDPQALVDYLQVDATKPKPYVPFAVPMRLTNNARCLGGGPGAGARLYCTETALNYGLKNQCVDTATIPTGTANQTTDICINEDGLPNIANVAATRARMSLQPRTDALGETIGAWVQVIVEESKGLGRFFFKVGETGVEIATPCEEGTDDCEVADDGKSIWYFSFEMGIPQTSADLSATGLVRNLVSQGNVLNQPEIDWRTGQFFPPMRTADMWNFIGNNSGTDYNYLIYRTEISRRGSLMVQPMSNVSTAGSKLTAMPLYKQGLMQQGGPADIMARRIIDAGASANPYDFANMVCAEAYLTDGSNPFYPRGLCFSPAINLSSKTPMECEPGGGGENDTSDGICPTIDADGIASDDPTDQNAFDKMTFWVQCPGSPECGTFPESVALGSNLDDQSWHNPLAVAKGHRGYIWRDMVMAMYVWSPNWKRNTRGNDRYELYIRRSFDGGRTWTTTPASWGGIGTAHCDFMRDGQNASEASQVCVGYGAGVPEQARNVSQLQRSDTGPTYKFTVLDPRYAPDPPTMPTIGEFGDTSYDPDSDEFNPTRYFLVYETGDNTTTIDGEPEALDLFYSRAVRFGDHYQNWAPETDMENLCLPGPITEGVFCNEFERLNTGSEVSAEEASVAMSPAGDTIYSVWAQFAAVELPPGEPLSEARYARVWYTDEYIDWTAPDGPPADDPVIGDGDTYEPPRPDPIFKDGFEGP
jgi:hypothetical protein